MTRNILCYGDSNTWGFIPNSFDMQTLLAKRYNNKQRWTGVLRQELGDNYYVLEDGLNGRTTAYDDFISVNRYRNGLTYLPLCLETHYPIDLIIFMLGINDTKIHFNKSVIEITASMQQLLKFVKTSNKGRDGASPQILLVAEQPMLKIAVASDLFNETSVKKSIELTSAFKLLAQEENVHFLNCGDYVESSKLDGYHLDESAHKILGRVMAEKMKEIFNDPNIIKKDDIHLVSYNPEWPKLANLEIQKIKNNFPEKGIIDIQHIGSTAIPGLSAKPIIDIQIAVKSLEVISHRAILELQKLGYEYWADNPDKTKMFFVKGMPPYGEKRSHHVHIVEKKSRHWRNTLQFRDYLRENLSVAKEYEKLKKKLASEYAYDREKYTDEKADFIKDVLKRARIASIRNKKLS